MSSAHPNLEAKQRKRRERARRNLLLFGVMALGFVGALTYVLMNAGRWGVPMFGYTNEFGSPCKNGFVGRTCDPMTLADIEDKARIDAPEGTQVLIGVWKQTHDYELAARLVYPQAGADQAAARLRESFGDCRHNLPNPLTQVAGLTDICTMTNVGAIKTDGKQPDARLWQVSMGRQPDGNTVVDLHIRSR